MVPIFSFIGWVVSCSVQAKPLIEAPYFSQPSGFYSEAFDLHLQHPQPEVSIYYTVDGSEPDPANLGGSTYRYKNHYAQPPEPPSTSYIENSYKSYLYEPEQPIAIRDRQQQPNRLATISTTWDTYPDYFPGEVLSTWKNSSIRYMNTAIHQLTTWIDVESFIDYHAAQVFLANADWPHNNIRYWRYKGSKKYPITAEGYTDGRWRWLLFDLDHMGGGIAKNNPSYEALKYATRSSEGWPTFLLRTLLENPDFKQQFIRRFSDLLNSHFLTSSIHAEIDRAVEGIAAEMPHHIQRWGAPESMGSWQKSVADLKAFFEQRPQYQWQHLEQFFELESPYRLKVSLAAGEGRIQVNSLSIEAATTPWQGQYFKQQPLALHAKPAQGYSFSHWELKGMELSAEQKNKPTLHLSPNADVEVRAVMTKP